MVTGILCVVLFLIFAVLSGFHFYWLFGGVWGLDSVIPTKGDQAESLKIPWFATLLVALLLGLAGLMYLMKAGMMSNFLPDWMYAVGFWIIPVVFIVRAIGEFKYVGLFKKIKHSKFAKADTKIFSPLCLLIGALGIIIQLWN